MVVRILECLGKSLVGIRISELFRSSSWEPVSVFLSIRISECCQGSFVGITISNSFLELCL